MHIRKGVYVKVKDKYKGAVVDYVLVMYCVPYSIDNTIILPIILNPIQFSSVPALGRTVYSS